MWVVIQLRRVSFTDPSQLPLVVETETCDLVQHDRHTLDICAARARTREG
eukprot:m.142106 g.142106  ORF g.142106 m.142106 type:complete len:50 (+) comp16143_c0_seq53:487-636(+)